jgi:catechol 2,3-dioxygenase-like lactoylglutathione lyase family enzyme
MSSVASQLNISKVGRVCVTVADTDRALDFYTGKLGFEKVVDEPMGPGMRWVEVKVADGETTIALAPPTAARPGSSSTRPTWTERTRR